MIIKNGRVFQEDGTFAEKDLYIEGKRFVSTKEEVIDQEVIDAKGMMVLPGLVDVHSHGAAGHDFSDGDVEGLKEILRYEKADRKSTRLNSSHIEESRMPSSA